MQARQTLALALSSLFLAACSSSSNSPRAVDTPPANNNNGSPVTGVLTARFDPATSTIPLPNNLLLSGTTDLTLNPPVANPANFGDPLVAISTLDGWSTTAPFTASFSAAPAAASLVPGTSIRVFEVTLTGPGGGVTGVTRELAGGTEFVAALAPSDTTGRTLAIVPTAPLKQLTSYMVVVTDDVRDTLGNDATPDQTYFLAKRTSPLITPLPKYFSRPSSVSGSRTTRLSARNRSPCFGSVSRRPLTRTRVPGPTLGTTPTMVTRFWLPSPSTWCSRTTR